MEITIKTDYEIGQRVFCVRRALIGDAFEVVEGKVVDFCINLKKGGVEILYEIQLEFYDKKEKKRYYDTSIHSKQTMFITKALANEVCKNLCNAKKYIKSFGF